MTKHQQISQNWRHDTQHNDIHPNDTQHNDTQQKGLISDITTLIIKKRCHYAECHCAECRDLFIGMLNVVRLNVIMLSVVAPILADLLMFCHQIVFEGNNYSLTLWMFSFLVK
jgi:hypothetical protein